MAHRYAHGKRYREIISVFSKYGFETILEQVGVYKHIGLNKIKIRVGNETISLQLSSGERLRMALEELGPTFIKVGQVLSTRSDLLPADIVEELKNLQKSVQPFPFSQVKEMIEEEFQDSLDHIFMEFGQEPVAAASISQVHKAKFSSGKTVAVKVQRPNIRDTINVDLEILRDIAKFIDQHTKYGKIYHFTDMAAEFQKTLENELDFTKEAENAEIFRQNFLKDEKDLYKRQRIQRNRRFLLPKALFPFEAPVFYVLRLWR